MRNSDGGIRWNPARPNRHSTAGSTMAKIGPRAAIGWEFMACAAMLFGVRNPTGDFPWAAELRAIAALYRQLARAVHLPISFVIGSGKPKRRTVGRFSAQREDIDAKRKSTITARITRCCRIHQASIFRSWCLSGFTRSHFICGTITATAERTVIAIGSSKSVRVYPLEEEASPPWSARACDRVSGRRL